MRFRVIALALLGLALPTAGRAEATRLSIAEVSVIAFYWPSFIAEAKGLYAREGVAPEVVYAGSPAAAIQQLVGGSVDLGSSTFDSALRAAASGAPVRVVAATVSRYPYSIMVAPGIASAADLRGKVVSLSIQKDITTVIFRQWLARQGVDPASVDTIHDAATPNRYAALASRSAQAAMLGAPFDFRAAAEGYRKLVDLGAEAKEFPFICLVATPQGLAAKGEAVRAYLRAQQAAIGWLYDPANRAEAIAILAAATKQDAAVAAQTWEYYVAQLKPLNQALAVPGAALAAETKALVEIGDLPSAEAVPAGFVDAGYLPAGAARP